MLTPFMYLAFGVLFGLILLRDRTKNPKRLPPGPIKWPIIGNVIDLALLDSKYPHVALAKLSKKYGDVMSFQLGVHPMIVVSSYESMKAIFHNSKSAGRYPFQVVPDRAYGKRIGIVWGQGEHAAELRKFTVKILKNLGLGKMQQMDLILQDELNEMISIIKKETELNNGIWNVDPHNLSASVVSILWATVGGHRLPKDDPKFKRLVAISDAQIGIFNYNNVYNLFPILKDWFPKWSDHDKHMQIHTEFQDRIKEMIDDSKEKRESREDKQPQNYIEHILDKVKDNCGNTETAFTDQQMIVALMDLFVGGSETTSTGLNWIILMLALHPEQQVKIQKEISNTIKDGQTLSVRDVGRMLQTKSIILEILRCVCFGPIPPTRQAIEDFEYNGMTIPKGTGLMFNLLPLFEDERYWRNPKKFEPERFLNEDQTALIKPNVERVMAQFGFGKRNCIGEGLAMNSMFFYTVSLLQSFSFEVIPGQEPSIENPDYKLTVAPRRYSVKVQIRL